ncbi:MAG: helix-turn-helix domain-containing protein, partial [Clostridiaceae bacterium]|nr:helix-turn-helix domain-containing protein [Clostridiaceae bacterium]
MSRQTEKKLNRLMEKSEELFWKYGYGPVTVDQIADEAGISKMTIYKYFHSKEDLFIEVLKKSIEFHVNRVMEVIAEKNHAIEKIELLYNYSMNIAVGYSDNLLRDIVERKSIFDKVMEMKKIS